MTAHRPKRNERDVMKALRDADIPFRITEGSKHLRVFVNDKQALVLSKGGNASISKQKLESFIRRQKEALSS